jgi:F-type H+-transporting ATPase subunit gamma
MRRIEEKTEALRRKYNVLRQEEITEEIELIMLSSDASISHPRRSRQPVGWAER